MYFGSRGYVSSVFRKSRFRRPVASTLGISIEIVRIRIYILDTRETLVTRCKFRIASTVRRVAAATPVDEDAEFVSSSGDLPMRFFERRPFKIRAVNLLSLFCEARARDRLSVRRHPRGGLSPNKTPYARSS